MPAEKYSPAADEMPAIAAREVVVVGGGPAGLAAAATAAHRGADVLLVEAAREFGQPVRSTGGSWPQDLERFGLDESVWHLVRNCELWSGRTTVRFESPDAVGCVLDIPRAWALLAERARRRGAELRTGVAGVWEGLIPGAAVIGLRAGGDTSLVRARMAIDATGHRAALARRAGVASGPCRVGVGVEETIHAPDWDQGTIVLGVGEIAPGGYGWLFPEGEGNVRLGIGVTRPGPRVAPVELLRHWLATDSRLDALRGGRLISRQGGTIPIAAHRPPPVGDRLLVAGDAGGSISLLAGEEIRYALQEGDLAGRIAADALPADMVDARFLRATYARRWDHRYGRFLRRGDQIYFRAAALDDEQWEAVLRRAARLSPDELTALVHGDLSLAFLARVWWRTRPGQRTPGGTLARNLTDLSGDAQHAAIVRTATEPPAAVGACGCKDRCQCGSGPRARHASNRLLPRVIETLRQSSRPVRLCTADEARSGLASAAPATPLDEH